MYTFNMQSVLDHRQFIEDNLKRELAGIRQQVLAARLHLKSLEKKEMDTTAVLKKEQVNGLSSDQVVAYHAYLNRLMDRIAMQKMIVTEIEQKESAALDELREAMKKRQILDKLKNQGQDRYNQAMLKKEMNFIDEIAVNQFVRKTIEKRGEGQ